MALKKRVLKSKPECKVTFTIPKEASANARSIHLVGDFNEWNETEMPLKKDKQGIYSISLNLPVGKSYQFRYLINGEQWINDWNADDYAVTQFNSENSVVSV